MWVSLSGGLGCFGAQEKKKLQSLAPRLDRVRPTWVPARTVIAPQGLHSHEHSHTLTLENLLYSGTCRSKRVGFVLTWARSKAFRTAAGRAYNKKKGVCFTTKSNATGRGTFCYTFPDRAGCSGFVSWVLPWVPPSPAACGASKPRQTHLIAVRDAGGAARL